MARPVLLIGTLDTKGEELRYLKECLTAAGAATEVVDASVLGEPLFAADVRREEIPAAAGESIEELRAAADRGRAVAAMQLGVALGPKLWKKGEWNSLRARIEGDVPHITVWMNGTKFTDWSDTGNHQIDGAVDGKIALQVHSGKASWR